MQKRMIILSTFLLVVLLLSACGGKTEVTAEPISVQRALETTEENLGSKICVRGYPVAFFYSYTLSGSKVYSIYFSDSAEDFYGEIESTEELGEGWLEVVVREKNVLWKTVKAFFDEDGQTQPVSMLLECVESRISGIYYDFVDFH